MSTREAMTHAESEENNTRIKALEALAISLGANEITAKLSASALLAKADLVKHLPYKGAKLETPPDIVRDIEAIGAWFLTGSDQQGQLKFTVGSRVLALLREPVKSGTFANLESWVGWWTNGTRNEVFGKLMAEKNS